MIRILSRDLTVKFSISVQTFVIALCSCVLGVTAAIVTVVMASGFSFLLFCLLYVEEAPPCPCKQPLLFYIFNTTQSPSLA